MKSSDQYKFFVETCYKKLKSSVFYDKTQLVLRDKIVAFESDQGFDEKLKSVVDLLEKIAYDGEYDVSSDPLFSRILSSIGVNAFPKKISKEEQNNGFTKDDTGNSAILISNIKPNTVCVDELQYYINMDVEGHILGIAWILAAGYLMDESLSDCSLGNRLRKNLFNAHNEPTYSPFLFEPYFQQYESWRDVALDKSQEHLNKGQDVIILTMDFQRFFYSLNISEKKLMSEVKKLIKNGNPFYKELSIPLTKIIFLVLSKYSEVLHEYYDCKKKNILLPIGFAPSNIISNYSLKDFDSAVLSYWNPIYYGRYVDDIIVVDKVEHQSDIYKKALSGKLTADDVISYCVLSPRAWHKQFSMKEKEPQKGLLYIRETKGLPNDINLGIDPSKQYYVSEPFLVFDRSKISLNNSKFKIFYFNAHQSDALIDCFRNRITQNKSEFRFLPEDEPVFQSDDYSEIYSLVDYESPQKLRGVEDIQIDKFNLSKFLGKMMRIGGIVSDPKEKRFFRDLNKIFDYETIIDNYLTWEKVVTIMTVEENWSVLDSFITKVCDSIKNTRATRNNGKELSYLLNNSLIAALKSVIARSFSLVWSLDAQDTLIKITKRLSSDEEWEELFIELNTMRQHYCLTRMCDKYAMPILIDEFINNQNELMFNDDTPINLSVFTSIQKARFVFEDITDDFYKFYPCLITVNDLTFHSALVDMTSLDNEIKPKSILGVKFENASDKIDCIYKAYAMLNYRYCGDETISENLLRESPLKGQNHYNERYISVGKDTYSNVVVAVANASVQESDVVKAFSSSPNRSYKRYEKLVSIVNQAFQRHANLLVMPELFVPFEWLPILSRTCAKNNMAIVTGVEYVILQGDQGKNVYNLTAVILPFEVDKNKLSYIHFHKKKHMAPHEIEIIESYHCHYQEGDMNEVFCWNNFWFPVYCCYDLTSIKDRSSFMSIADAVVAVEWNKDVSYYSNIVESLSRDLHCYFIQVNLSTYGDSRITQPSKTVIKDLVNVKGGKNPTVIIDTIEIDKLRRFQLKGNKLQIKDGENAPFKPTPPDIDYDIIQDKIDGILWDKLDIHLRRNDTSSH